MNSALLRVHPRASGLVEQSCHAVEGIRGLDYTWDHWQIALERMTGNFTEILS